MVNTVAIVALVVTLAILAWVSRNKKAIPPPTAEDPDVDEDEVQEEVPCAHCDLTPSEVALILRGVLAYGKEVRREREDVDIPWTRKHRREIRKKIGISRHRMRDFLLHESGTCEEEKVRKQRLRARIAATMEADGSQQAA